MKNKSIEKLDSKKRIESIDVFRGFTILVMIFVNDIAGLDNIPTWLEHADVSLNSMTFVDVVFPVFLFIIGMAIPYSLKKRINEGGSKLGVYSHILIRTASLVAIGVLMVNTETIAPKGYLPAPIWILLMYAGVLMVWNNWSNGKDVKTKVYIIRICGACLLLALVFLYNGNNVESLISIRPQWWGMIGLIGWAYLGACLFYVLFSKTPEAILGSAILLYFFYLINNSVGFVSIPLLDDFGITGEIFGPHAAVILSGTFLGQKLSEQSNALTHNKMIKWAFIYGLFLFATGKLIHGMSNMHEVFIVNKENSTPAWALLSSAYAVWFWVLIYWITDVKKWKIKLNFLKLAGANALFAFIVAPILYSLFSLISLTFNSPDFYDLLRNNTISGITTSFILTYFLTWLTGYLYKKQIIWLKV